MMHGAESDRSGGVDRTNIGQASPPHRQIPPLLKIILLQLMVCAE